MGLLEKRWTGICAAVVACFTYIKKNSKFLIWECSDFEFSTISSKAPGFGLETLSVPVELTEYPGRKLIRSALIRKRLERLLLEEVDFFRLCGFSRRK
jgi:hypothetical protein